MAAATSSGFPARPNAWVSLDRSRNWKNALDIQGIAPTIACPVAHLQGCNAHTHRSVFRVIEATAFLELGYGYARTEIAGS